MRYASTSCDTSVLYRNRIFFCIIDTKLNIAYNMIPNQFLEFSTVFLFNPPTFIPFLFIHLPLHFW